ncbi:MAG: IPExxxVDY family protein, partial [Ferruginibacter sp.]
MLKLKLDNNAAEISFFEDARIIGMVAPLKDYSFIWNLNNQLGFNFRINNFLEIQLKRKGRDYFFDVFEYKSQTSEILHYIYNNQHDGEFLLPELKHLDFLLLLKFEIITNEEVKNLMEAIRKISGVQLV